MGQRTRRDFIKSGMVILLSGVGYTLFPCCALPDKGKTLRWGKDARIDRDFIPGYLKLHRTGKLKERGETLWQIMKECRLCPRECGAHRLAGERGICQSTKTLKVASHNPHFGEERPLVGRGGSGTIFFSNCNLRCVFCINWRINHLGRGEKCSLNQLAAKMLYLQKIGCHNINLVTPTHYSPHILLALDIAAAQGLRLPVVYNTSGWERMEVLKILDGIVDIYLPDFKYFRGKMAAAYSAGAETYPQITKQALLEMNRQCGVAIPAADKLMYRGIMIRHLVLPNNVSGTRDVVYWLAAHLPKNTFINIMSQYTPVHRAREFPKIARRITSSEFKDAIRWAKEAGLTRIFAQRKPV